MPLTLARKLLSRNSLVFWAVLAGGITLVIWITDTTQTALRAPPVAKHEPDYYMEKFKLTITDPQGVPRQWLEADKMLHYVDRTAELTAPLLRAVQANKGEWRVRALLGSVESDQQINLTGDVTVEYHASQSVASALSLRTDQLRVNLADNTGATDGSVTMEQANARVSAVGLRFDLNQQQMHLLANVRGQYAAQ